MSLCQHQQHRCCPETFMGSFSNTHPCFQWRMYGIVMLHGVVAWVWPHFPLPGKELIVQINIFQKKLKCHHFFSEAFCCWGFLTGLYKNTREADRGKSLPRLSFYLQDSSYLEFMILDQSSCASCKKIHSLAVLSYRKYNTPLLLNQQRFSGLG